LTETAADVLTQLAPQLGGVEALRPVSSLAIPGAPHSPAPRVVEPVDDEDEAERILERLGPTPVAVDELVRQCQMSAAVVATLLLELELAGRVERHPRQPGFLALRRFSRPGAPIE
jgi:DNA processing protein